MRGALLLHDRHLLLRSMHGGLLRGVSGWLRRLRGRPVRLRLHLQRSAACICIRQVGMLRASYNECQAPRACLLAAQAVYITWAYLELCSPRLSPLMSVPERLGLGSQQILTDAPCCGV